MAEDDARRAALHAGHLDDVVHIVAVEARARCHDDVVALADLGQQKLTAQLADIVECTTTLAARRQINDHYLEELRGALAVPRIELPHLFVPDVQRPQIDELAQRISEAMMETETHV